MLECPLLMKLYQA